MSGDGGFAAWPYILLTTTVNDHDSVLGSHCTIFQVCMEGAVDALAVPSDELHTPLSEIGV
jgi:hypothetical protein